MECAAADHSRTTDTMAFKGCPTNLYEYLVRNEATKEATEYPNKHSALRKICVTWILDEVGRRCASLTVL